MVKLQRQALDDRAGRSGGRQLSAPRSAPSGLNASGQPGPHVHQPEAARLSATASRPQRVIDRLRRALARIGASTCRSVAAHATSAPARARARATTSSPSGAPSSTSSMPGCRRWSSGSARCRGITDVTTDREQGGLQASIAIDRQAAARLGVRVQDINSALNNAFSQRQISTIYTQRNQYRVDPRGRPALPARPADLSRTSSCRAATARRCRSPALVARRARLLAPLVVNHQGPFPAVTISYGLSPT